MTFDELDPGPPPEPAEDYRICSNCLLWWLRSDYSRHMQDDHGYEVLHPGDLSARPPFRPN